MVYYLGYKCPWDKFPSMTFLDGDPLSLELAEPSPDAVQASSGTRQKALVGYPIKPDRVPTTLQWGSRHEMPDFEGPLGFLCVSPRMKDIIERFEPGVHQFFPLKVVDKAGEEIAQRWLWVVCNNIDSVDREHTNLEFRNNMRWRADKIENPRLVFSLAQIGDHHFWRDPHLSQGNLLCSNVAGAALEAAGLTAIQLRKSETI